MLQRLQEPQLRHAGLRLKKTDSFAVIRPNPAAHCI